MKEKIRLEVDELVVQSYATDDAARPSGTVRAHEDSFGTQPCACAFGEGARFSQPGYCRYTWDWNCTVHAEYCTSPEGCWQNYTVNVSCTETYVCAQ